MHLCPCKVRAGVPREHKLYDIVESLHQRKMPGVDWGMPSTSEMYREDRVFKRATAVTSSSLLVVIFLGYS